MTEIELRNKAVATAVAWLGCKESNGSHKKIIDLYNSHRPLARGYKVKYTDPWCATAVSAVSIACNLTDIFPTECSCSKMIDLFKKLGSWVESDSYTPQPADVCFYDWDDTGKGDNTGHSDHVGLVEKVQGDTIYVIEGNYSNAVKRRTIKINGKYIRGYGVPNYASKAGRATTTPAAPAAPAEPAAPADNNSAIEYPILKKGSTGPAVEALQILLAWHGYNCGDYGPKKDGVDGEYGAATVKAVKAYQKTRGLIVDGEAGPDTLGSLYGLK